MLDVPCSLTKASTQKKIKLTKLIIVEYHESEGLWLYLRRINLFPTEKMWYREVNNRLTGWAFAHLVNYFAQPVKLNLLIAQNCPTSDLSCPDKKYKYAI